MRKISLFMLMAVGLLISTQGWAQETNNVRLTYGSFQQNFTSLQDAFNALPENSTPATVTLLDDVYIEFEQGHYVHVEKYQNVTIDLMGYDIYAAQTTASNSCVIENKGTLTIVDNSTDKLGVISNTSENPDDASSPSRANNVINNYGTLILKSGTIINNTSDPEAVACYAIDQITNGTDASFIMEGGELKQPYNDCVRLRVSSETYNNSAIIKGGKISAGGTCLWIQGEGGVAKAPKAEITIIDGTLISTSKPRYISSWMWWWPYCGPNVIQTSTACLRTNYIITVSGGTLYGCVDTGYRGSTFRKGKIDEAVALGLENVNISGGTFYNSVIDEQVYTNPGFQNAASVTLWATIIEEHEEGFITGGVFPETPSDISTDPGYYVVDFYDKKYTTKGWENYIAEGYTKEFDHHDNENNIDYYRVVPAKQVNLEVNSGEIDLSKQSIALDEMTDLTITPISDGNTTINIDVNTEVNKIKVIAPDDKGEAQIVVKDGYTLNVGNGGLVSENDDLVFVKVEAGGKLTVGNNGVDQQGEQYPIIVENNGEKSGVYMVSPDATDSRITEPEATVCLYTRAYMTATTNRWEQFACPVKEVKYMKPMGAAANNDAFGTEVYEWNYATDAWHIINTSRKEGWTTGINLVPFKAYDLINNSLPSEGGITYEFRGKLVGNKDMDLIFPEHGFCVFGNSYTAPIDLTVLFGKIQNDIEADNIDPCVYIYDSKSDRFVSVNALDLYLHGIGAADVDFTQIPPQQAFVMNLIIGNSGATSVDYRNAVWGNTQNVNIPIMAPQRQDISEFGTIASIKVSDATSQDKVLLVESDKYAATYDRGADAEKYMDGQHFNLYASTEAGNLCNIATNDLEGTILTFQAGEALDYELSIDNVIGSNYGVKDLLTNTVINLNEGNTYSFTAQPNSTMDRFQVVKVHTMATDLQKAKATASAKGIYTILGHYLGETSMWHSLPAGVYVVNGVKMAK